MFQYQPALLGSTLKASQITLRSACAGEPPDTSIYKHKHTFPMKNKNVCLCLCALAFTACSQTGNRLQSLIPDTPSQAPDYLCTWNLQGYAVSYTGSEPTRKVMNEEHLFGDGPYQNWTSLYPSIRQDLYFVMDDSWDIPQDCNDKNGNPYLGTAELDETRFPSFTGTPEERLKKLVERIKSLGWKGAGGWICAQKPEQFSHMSEEAYWTERLQTAHKAGFAYWKVDWGKNDRDDRWRRMLAQLGRKHAPGLWMEHAMKNQYVEFSDAFRTYDVENVIAQPVTIQRVADLLPFKTEEDAKGIVNCEDEPYIAVGLGCAIGIMRHPFAGNLPDGRQDEAFPPVGHNYKKCLDEVVRAVRWHRLAEPFAVNADCVIDTVRLTDHWELHENETWNKGHKAGSQLTASAPARMSRNMRLPLVSDTSACRPYILASTYPNGAVALSAIGRAIGREYICQPVTVTLDAADWKAPVGLFGHFKEVILEYPAPPKPGARFLAQDLAGDTPVDVTSQITIEGSRLIVPGELIDQVGLMYASEGDLSDPGMVIRMQ